MGSKVMSPEAVVKAREMYAETVNEWGKKRYSIAEIARFFGVGETTALRAIKGLGSFTTQPVLPDPPAEEIAESEKRMQEWIAAGMPIEAPKPLTTNIEPLSPEVQERLKGYGYGKKE